MVHLSPYPLVERVNLRSLLKATGVLLGTVHRSLKEGEIRGSNLYVLPVLSHKQMLHQVDFVLNRIKPNGMFRNYSTSRV